MTMDEVYHTVQKSEKKICKACNKEKCIEEYYKDRKSVRTICKDCVGNQSRAIYTPKSSRKFSIFHGIILQIGNKTLLIPLAKTCTKCEAEKLLDQFYWKNNFPTAKCAQCQSDEAFKWHEEHPEQVKQIIQKRQVNPKYIEYHREKENMRYNTMPEVRQKAIETTKAYRKANPLKKREWESRRDGRKQATQTDPIDYETILERDGMCCYICQKDILPHHELTFDHKIPLCPRKNQPKGTHTAENIHPTHKSCNLRKSNKRFEDMSDFSRRGVE